MNRTEYRRLKEEAKKIVEESSELPENMAKVVFGRLKKSIPDLPEKTVLRAVRKARREKLGLAPSRSGTAPNFCVVATEDERAAILRFSKKDKSTKAGQFHRAMKIYTFIRNSDGGLARLEKAFPGIAL